MDINDARRLRALLQKGEGQWKDETHIVCITIRKSACMELSRDPQVDLIEAVELYLVEPPVNLDCLYGIFAVDDQGIWFCDDDGAVEEAVWRQYLVPWSNIKSLVIHQSS